MSIGLTQVGGILATQASAGAGGLFSRNREPESDQLIVVDDDDEPSLIVVSGPDLDATQPIAHADDSIAPAEGGVLVSVVPAAVQSIDDEDFTQ